MVKQYFSLLLLIIFGLFLYDLVKPESFKQNQHISIFDDRELLKSTLDNSLLAFYSYCPDCHFYKPAIQNTLSENDRLKEVCEHYRSNIQNHLKNLLFEDKKELLNQIILENKHALNQKRELSANKIFYHQYCIQFAEDELKSLTE